MTKPLSLNALQLFDLYVRDAGNWSGSPMVGGNVELLGAKEDRGLLTHLKRAGLIRTFSDEGNMFVVFTKDGIQFAAQRDHDVTCLTGYREWSRL